MADAIFIKSENDREVTILNQPGTTYDLAVWHRLQAALGLTDQELANRLNNEPTP